MSTPTPNPSGLPLHHQPQLPLAPVNPNWIAEERNRFPDKAMTIDGNPRVRWSKSEALNWTTLTMPGVVRIDDANCMLAATMTFRPLCSRDFSHRMGSLYERSQGFLDVTRVNLTRQVRGEGGQLSPYWQRVTNELFLCRPPFTRGFAKDLQLRVRRLKSIGRFSGIDKVTLKIMRRKGLACRDRLCPFCHARVVRRDAELLTRHKVDAHGQTCDGWAIDIQRVGLGPYTSDADIRQFIRDYQNQHQKRVKTAFKSLEKAEIPHPMFRFCRVELVPPGRWTRYDDQSRPIPEFEFVMGVVHAYVGQPFYGVPAGRIAPFKSNALAAPVQRCVVKPILNRAGEVLVAAIDDIDTVLKITTPFCPYFQNAHVLSALLNVSPRLRALRLARRGLLTWGEVAQ